MQSDALTLRLASGIHPTNEGTAALHAPGKIGNLVLHHCEHHFLRSVEYTWWEELYRSVPAGFLFSWPVRRVDLLD